MTQTGYVPGSGPTQGVTATDPAQQPALTHGELKKQYLTYLNLKSDEIKEQQDARRYYHGVQWTDKQIKAFNQRKQPVVTYNRIGRKINAVVGLLEKQRTDPKGFPRTPKHEDGAEIATAVLRYVCDEQEWAAKSPIAGLNGAVDGIGGIEIIIEEGDRGDREVGFEDVDPSSFFYDPRSLKMDFSDARYMGVSKWADVDQVIELAPHKEDEIRSAIEAGSELTSNPDYENKWFSSSEDGRKVRLVDHWYMKGSKWYWCLYTGATILLTGESYLLDEKERTECKYIMYSANVDQDGDRYGFVRNMKSSQDEINQRRSKGLHLLNSRRIIIADGTYPDVEKLRVEAARPDGVIVYPPNTEPPAFDDSAKNNELTGQLNFLADAKQEIENYGFNPALIGSGVQDMSGRAIQLQQQAGIAELGPYLLAFKGWKLRVYRAIWNAVQRHWTAERWIRVTDDQQVAQFFAVNQLAIDPSTGQPTIVNSLGSLDVDIIIDEGPDTINMQADAYDTLSVMGQKGQQVPPEVIIELSPLQGSVKKKVLGMIEQAKQQAMQAQQPAMQLQAADAKAKIDNTQADTRLKMANAAKAGADAMQGQPDTSGKDNLDWQKALLSSLTSIEVARIGAKTDMDSQQIAAGLETSLHLSDQAHERDIAQINGEQRALQAEQIAKQRAQQPA
ncbi:hypothetical protein [Mesorhizobium sp. B2-3-2]|uniref:portal protein n=1 Tax=Mesorhizobium sp. B2-3-2 TaxID=2589961 RepID=UPI00112E450B|nr:hypothetical protein [Mesorhizobium sp. B2-3-2]TPM37043.1 hypothetical protein FJ964_30380 [Mesorhizobium sp. B2-3-2]